MSANGVTKSSNSMKHTQQQNSATTNANHPHNNNNSNNNNSANTNLLSNIGHNASPILPMTPTSSVSPPINVTFKKESGGYQTMPGLSDVMKTASIHDTIKEEMNMCTPNPSAYSNINARLGQGGNLTPLGSNSSIMTTPSPPITPSHNAALSYVPNHDAYMWHTSQYNQYGNNYNPPTAYYSQMDYQNQSSYSSMGHSGYSMSNLGLPAGAAFNGSMASQPFTSNGIDYMTPQDTKYVNMV